MKGIISGPNYLTLKKLLEKNSIHLENNNDLAASGLCVSNSLIYFQICLDMSGIGVCAVQCWECEYEITFTISKISLLYYITEIILHL